MPYSLNVGLPVLAHTEGNGIKTAQEEWYANDIFDTKCIN